MAYAQDNRARLFDRLAQTGDSQRVQGEVSSPVKVLRGTYIPYTPVMICPIVATVGSQSQGEYRRNDWVASNYGGWDTPDPPVNMTYTAYVWQAGLNSRGGATFAMLNSELDPPLNTAESSSATSFIAHRLDFGLTSYHAATHGGGGLLQIGSYPDNFQTRDMPVGFGDGHVILRDKKEIRPRMSVTTINGTGVLHW